MKTNAIIRIILFSLAIVVLLSILGVGIGAKMYMFDGDSTMEGTVSSSGTADPETVKKISIDWADGTISMRYADVKEITFTESGAEKINPMVWSQSGDTLTIAFQEDRHTLNFGNITGKDLLIEVPWEWVCEELEIEAAAAEVHLDNMSIGTIDFDGASGEIFLDYCSVDSLDIDTASGDIVIQGSLNTLDCDAASADCEIYLENVPSSIDLDVASGDLELSLPENAGFNVRMEVVSGDFTTEFEVTENRGGFTHGDGGCRIDIVALSGDVNILKSAVSVVDE